MVSRRNTALAQEIVGNKARVVADAREIIRNPDIDIVVDLPADAVTASGSGLDPHLTLRAARAQLDRVAAAVAAKTGRDLAATRATLDAVLRSNAFTPMAGLVGGEPLVNVLEVNRAVLALAARSR